MMFPLVPYTKADLAEDLNTLVARAIGTKSDLDEWYKFAHCVVTKLRNGNIQSLGVIPEVVWHYLSDADIRFKDSCYRDAQEQEIKKIIAILRGNE